MGHLITRSGRNITSGNPVEATCQGCHLKTKAHLRLPSSDLAGHVDLNSWNHFAAFVNTTGHISQTPSAQLFQFGPGPLHVPGAPLFQLVLGRGAGVAFEVTKTSLPFVRGLRGLGFLFLRCPKCWPESKNIFVGFEQQLREFRLFGFATCVWLQLGKTCWGQTASIPGVRKQHERTQRYTCTMWCLNFAAYVCLHNMTTWPLA